MTLKLTRAQSKERDDITASLRRASDAYVAARTAYADGLAALNDQFREALGEYNGALEEAREFVAGIAEDAESEIGGKSDKWQEGDKGRAASEWAEAWTRTAEALEGEDFDFPDPPYDEFDPSELPGQIEDLPEVPEGEADQ